MNWTNIFITIRKELRGIIRDRKSLQKLIIYPLLIPAILLLFGVLFDGVNESKYTVGINYSLTEEEQSIIDELDNIEMKEYSNVEKLKESYEKGEIAGYIIKEGKKYTIYADGSQNSGDIARSLSYSYLDSYNMILGQQYLMENQIDPIQVFQSIEIDEVSLTKDDSNYLTVIIFSLVITYLIMIVVMVCVVVVTDATSGEKERGTLETILTFPIRSSELVFGKYLATSILGFMIGLIAYLLSIPTILIGQKLFKSYEELTFNTHIGTILLVIFVIFLTALLASGVCMALAGKARTYKEAQSSLQFISILPMIPYFLQMMEVNNKIFNFIPIANCGSLLNDIIINDMNLSSFFTVVLTTILYTILILNYISRQYKKEETLFS